MGNFSRDTFDALKRYVAVRMQQGVPIVDADINELDDIRAWEVRTFIRWFIGDGVPEGNDGFCIRAFDPPVDNDFLITGGDGTAIGAGRCLVDGRDVMLAQEELAYTAQTEHDVLNPPAAGKRKDIVYLDVWEREVNHMEDSTLIDDRIGVETCVRHKREWLVRVAPGSDAPPAPAPGHAHYVLASIARVANKPSVEQGDIQDLRRTGVRLLSISDPPMRSLIRDTLGPYQIGDAPQLSFSLREAINRMMWGQLPVLAEKREAARWTSKRNWRFDLCALADKGRREAWLFWVEGHYTFLAQSEIYCSRWTADLGASDKVRVSPAVGLQITPKAVFSNGMMTVFWIAGEGEEGQFRRVRYRSCDAAGTWNSEQILDECSPKIQPAESAQPADDEPALTAHRDGRGFVWVIYVDVAEKLQFRRRAPGSSVWQAGEVSEYGASAPGDGTAAVKHRCPGVVELGDTTLALYWQAQASAGTDTEPHIWWRRYSFANGTWTASGAPERLSFEGYQAKSERFPLAICQPKGHALFLWQSQRSDEKTFTFACDVSAEPTMNPVQVGSQPTACAAVVVPGMMREREVILGLANDAGEYLRKFSIESWVPSHEVRLSTLDGVTGLACCDMGDDGVFMFYGRTHVEFTSSIYEIGCRRLCTFL